MHELGVEGCPETRRQVADGVAEWLERRRCHDGPLMSRTMDQYQEEEEQTVRREHPDSVSIRSRGQRLGGGKTDQQNGRSNQLVLLPWHDFRFGVALS